MSPENSEIWGEGAGGDRLRLGFAGGFGHAVCVLDELQCFPGAMPTEICGLAPCYAGECIDAFACHPLLQDIRTFASLPEMLAMTKPDVLVVSTRPDQIFPAAWTGLKNGCHLILEKPVALRSESLATLNQAIKRTSLRIFAMLSMRSLPAFAMAREIVRDGQIGKVVLVNTRKSYKWGQRPDWFNDRTKYGGTWPWIGIHNLDMAQFITGQLPIRVCATHANLAHPALPGCEDVGSGIFTLENGAAMTASIDLCRPDSADSWGDDWIRVVGTQGVVEANASTGKIKWECCNGKSVVEWCSTKPLPIYLPFLRSLREPNAPPDLLALHLTAAALAARDSADSQTWRAISYL